MENCSFSIFNHARACKGLIGGEKPKNKSPENVCDLRQAINKQSWTSLELSKKRKKNLEETWEVFKKLRSADYNREMEKIT